MLGRVKTRNGFKGIAGDSVMNTPLSICIVRLSALGDVILTVPLIRSLQRAWPTAKITWVIAREFYPLVEGMSGVEFIVISKPQKILDYWALRKLFSAYNFDILIAMQANLRVNLLYSLIKATRKIGFDSHRGRDLHHFFVNEQIEYKAEHLMEGFLHFLKSLGIQEKVVEWKLPLKTADFDWAHAQLPSKKVLVVHPMASKPERNWPVENYQEFINRAYNEYNYSIVITGGPSAAERELTQRILEKVEVPVKNLVGASTLKQLAAVLASVNVVVAPDTGPAHLASAMGTPVIGLYAVARPELTGPYFSHDLTVNKYPQAVKQFLQKDPATLDWHVRVHHPKAMSLISVDEVIEKLTKLSI